VVANDHHGDGVASAEIQLVSFELDSQEYALPIESVQEIVQVPETINVIPNTKGHILGVMSLRNRLLPLVSLRSLFGMPQTAVGDQSRIVVVGHRGQAIGLVTDTVKEVLRVPLSLVDPLPSLLSSGSGLREIDQICRMDGGKRLVSILLPDRLFNNTAVQDALGEVAEPEREKEMNGPTEATSREIDDEEQYVIFHVADEEYGVPIDVVQEIVRIPDQLTRVPKAPAFIEGVVNLRGAVLPVIDQRRRFSLPDVPRNDRQRIMVFTIRGLRTGFIVDSVSEVLKILRSQISPAPDAAANEESAISRVANIVAAKRMILMLDVERLLSPTETHAMKLAS
jgi:purine-binding chemotaxis protein CheW